MATILGQRYPILTLNSGITIVNYGSNHEYTFNTDEILGACSNTVCNDTKLDPQHSGIARVMIDNAGSRLSVDISEDKLDFGVVMEDIESALESILLNPTTTTNAAIKKVTPSLWMRDVFTPTGVIFCFELRHHQNSRKANSLLLLMKDKGLVDKDATEVPGDKLRLWVWVAANIGENDENFSKTISLVTTYGITSGFLENTIIIENKIDLPGRFVAIDNAAFYDSGDSAEVIYLDSGNITEADVSSYNLLFRDAIRRSTQGA